MGIRTLSSPQTFLIKFALPAFWICVGGIVPVLMCLGPPGGKGPTAEPFDAKIAFLGPWLAGCLFVLWICARLKRVRVDDRLIYISNYLKEISLPLSAIADVTENGLIHIFHSDPITVRFRRNTEFGEKITFVPVTSKRSLDFDPFGWTSHLVVDELRQLARRSGANPSSPDLRS
jgi:hypothetical protein